MRGRRNLAGTKAFGMPRSKIRSWSQSRVAEDQGVHNQWKSDRKQWENTSGHDWGEWCQGQIGESHGSQCTTPTPAPNRGGRVRSLFEYVRNPFKAILSGHIHAPTGEYFANNYVNTVRTYSNNWRSLVWCLGIWRFGDWGGAQPVSQDF